MNNSFFHKVWEWLKSSHRLLHLLIGIAVGLGANSWYCVEYVGLGIAGAMEFKDWQWGGQPDWIDALLTIIGVNIGYGLRLLVVSLF